MPLLNLSPVGHDTHTTRHLARAKTSWIGYLYKIQRKFIGERQAPTQTVRTVQTATDTANDSNPLWKKTPAGISAPPSAPQNLQPLQHFKKQLARAPREWVRWKVLPESRHPGKHSMQPLMYPTVASIQPTPRAQNPSDVPACSPEFNSLQQRNQRARGVPTNSYLASTAHSVPLASCGPLSDSSLPTYPTVSPFSRHPSSPTLPKDSSCRGTSPRFASFSGRQTET